MHIVTKNGTRLFTQEIADAIAVELFEGKKTVFDVRHKESVEGFANDYKKSAYSPSWLIDAFNNEEEELKAIFEGYPTAVLRVKKEKATPDEVIEMASTLKKQHSNRRYEPMTGENSERFIIEYTTARKFDIQSMIDIKKCVIDPFIENVN